MLENTKELTKPMKVDKILYRLGANVDPDIVEMEAIRFMDQYDNASKDEKKLMLEKNMDLVDRFSRMYEFEKHYLLADAMPIKYTSMALKMAKAIIKENNCNTVIEKSLVEIIVNAFCRSLYISANMKISITGKSVGVDQNFVNFYNFLSKEIDRANRQYLSALTTLQQMKMPTLKVNLRAETAIVAQNQQFNSVTKESHENDKTS